MKKSTKKGDRQVLVGLFLAVAALSLAYLIAHGLQFYMAEPRASVTARSLTAEEPNDVQIKAYLAEDFNSVAQLKKNNLFAPAPPKRNPVAAVQGIMGQSALINGKWYEVGDQVQDAKIVAIESTLVTVEWEGKKSTFAPISGGAGGPSPAGSPARPGRPGRGGRPAPSRGPIAKPGSNQPAMRVMKFSAEDMARFKAMSPEEQKAVKAEFKMQKMR